MTVLSNPRHERFAQELSRGRPASEAYVRAGYVKNDGNAIRLKGNEQVEQRVSEILTAAASRTEITVARVLDELAKIGFANMHDFIRTTEDGVAYTDLSQLTRDEAAAISEIIVDEYKEGRGEDARDVRKVRIKLHDKQAALEKLGKHLGMFPNKVDVSGTIDHQHQLRDPDQARALIQRHLERRQLLIAHQPEAAEEASE